MAKIYVSQSSVRPIRWLLRLLGWVAVAAGILTLIFGKNDFLTGYMLLGDSPAGNIGMGAFLVILDLVLPDPYRKARKAKRKLEKIYRKVYKTLPFGDGLNQLLKEYGQAELAKMVSQSIPFCQSVLNRHPCRQLLDFIHTYHPEAAYTICISGLKAAKTASEAPQVPKAPVSTPKTSSGTTTIIHGQNVSANTDSRINDINVLLGARGEKTPPVSGTPLGKSNIQLSSYLDPFYHRGDYYDASSHSVHKFVCIPHGPQGYSVISLPKEIQTLEQLLPYLEANHGFHLKA